MFHFQAYGLMLRSSVMLPGYKNLDVRGLQTEKQLKIDAKIMQGEVLPTGLKFPEEQGLFFQVNPDEICFNVPNIARFLVQNGERIVFEPEPGIDEDSVRVFLSGPCLAALLMQRNLFVLTGSVLKINDAAVAYIGDSCSGKSSLIAAMMQRGYLVMSDGLCVVNQDGIVFPGPSHIELWDDSAKLLNIPPKTLHSIRPKFKKFRLPIHDSFYSHPLPLKEVYALNPQKVDLLRYKRLTGSEKINFLQKNIYNKTYLAGFKKNQVYFEYCAKLAYQTKMTLVEFNGAEFNLQEVSHCIEALLQDSCDDT
jgi:hypothetical protein